MERDSKPRTLPRTFKGDIKTGNQRALPKRKPLIIALCLVLLVGGSVWMGIAAHRLWTAASAVRADLVALESLAASGAQALDLEEASGLLHTTRTDLETLQATARPFLWLPPYLGWLPRYGPDIQAAPLPVGARAPGGDNL